MVQFIKKYRHGLIILAYAIVYMLFFEYLECRPVWGFHVIDTVFDDYIPFCEYFIVPYLLWFPYQILTVLYFIFRNIVDMIISNVRTNDPYLTPLWSLSASQLVSDI